MKAVLRHTRYLPHAALACAALLLAFDFVAFWAFTLRPLASVDSVDVLLWAVLLGTALTAAVRWAVLRESRLRFQVAAALALMIAFSALHPWQNGYAADAELPYRESQSRAASQAVVKFERGPLTGPAEARW